MENNILQVKIKNIRGISFLEINMPLNPDVYAITGINGIGKSTVLSAISPRLVRPINFSMLRDFDFKSDSYISYSLNNNHEIWKPNEQNQWNCITEQCLNIRGFQEGSITKGTRFSNTSSYRAYKKPQHVNPNLVVPADPFVKENLGLILHNNKYYYQNLFRLERDKAYRIYHYSGVPYFFQNGENLLSYFDLSTGEFLLINLLHLLNNLLVRVNNNENLNLILIDEVELALHPSAIKRLVDFMRNIAHRYNVATYFSTHSLEIIHSLPIDNLFYLKQTDSSAIKCETPCYPAYVTRDIYYHSGYDVIILVEDDLAQYIVEAFIQKCNLEQNKRIQVLPIGGYDNTLDLHQNLLEDRVFSNVTHIISIIDGDVKEIVLKKKNEENLWSTVPFDNVLFLPIESLEKYLKKQIFDLKNHNLMRLIRDRLFKFKTEINWFESEYLENIVNRRNLDVAQNKQPKTDIEYFANGKNLFSILSKEYINNGGTRSEFRKNMCELVISCNNYSNFEEKLGTSLNQIFY